MSSVWRYSTKPALHRRQLPARWPVLAPLALFGLVAMAFLAYFVKPIASRLGMAQLRPWGTRR